MCAFEVGSTGNHHNITSISFQSIFENLFVGGTSKANLSAFDEGHKLVQHLEKPHVISCQCVAESNDERCQNLDISWSFKIKSHYFTRIARKEFCFLRS